MKTSRIMIALVLVAVLIVGSIYVITLLNATTPRCGSTWRCGAGYPVSVGGTAAIAGEQCVTSGPAIYCIGGEDSNGGPRNEVYASVPSASGNISGWAPGPYPYPRFINGESCVSESGAAYCVGGMYNDNGDDVASSYYANVTADGSLGNWSSTTPFPVAVDSQSCVASSSYIFCVGGVNETDGSNADATPTGSVWFAPLSASGIGSWKETTPYPANVYYPACSVAGNDIYCVGGADENGNSVGTSYYTTLSSTGAGTWTQTTSYPAAASGEACVMYAVDIVCVGGETAGGSSPTYTGAVYYAPVSSGGIGTWKQATSYPLAVGTACVALGGNLYCIGGFDQSSAGENDYVGFASLTLLTS